MMNNVPKVSIIIPAFNVEKYIATMIQSIIKQTYRNWELIIVDDGSTDHTYEIIKKLSDQDDRIILLKRNREPKGSLTCRNIGQKIATGKYFIHFDSDDLVEPFCLQQRVHFLENHPELEYATFKGATIIENSDGTIGQGRRKWGIKPNKDVLSCFLSANYPYSVWNNMYRMSSFKNYFWDESVRIYTDFSYIIPTIIYGKKHGFDEESKPDYLYCIGRNGAMTANFISEDKYQSTKYLFKKIMGLLDDNKYIVYKKDFNKYFLLQLQRIIEKGTVAQLDDFYKFFRYFYPKDNLNALLAYKIFRKKKAKKRIIESKWDKLIIYFLFSPLTILQWTWGKINRK